MNNYLSYVLFLSLLSSLSLTCRLSKSVKAVARGHTATVDAFLTPFLEAYIQGFLAGFEESIGDVDVSFMKSDGGLCPVQDFTGMYLRS
jgi:5-oxoprolinase (ATP-hydrolysing)